jgi:anti-anti-sigma factor
MPDVRQHITVVRGVPVIEAPAEIDISNAGALRAALQAAAACGYATFVVDMTSTGFCDCAGLQVLENAHRTARAEGGELRLIIPTAGLPHIFAVTGAERVIPTFTSLDEALAETPAITIQALWQPPSMLGILVNLPAPGERPLDQESPRQVPVLPVGRTCSTPAPRTVRPAAGGTGVRRG